MLKSCDWISRQFLFAVILVMLGAVGHAKVIDICDRTPQVTDAILAEIDRTDCSAVDSAHLAQLSSMEIDAPNDKVRTDLELAVGDFDGLAGLKSLLIRDYRVILPAGVFKSLPSLKGLGIASAQLTTLDGSGLDGLTELESLNLNDNCLETLPAAFDHLQKLKFLSLRGNCFESLSPSQFDGLTGLRRLHLGANNLRSVPEGAFDGLAELEQLDLSHNCLETLPAGVFDQLQALKSLYLNGNCLRSLPEVFDSLTALRELRLGDNFLDRLPAGIFDGLARLEVLSLDGNYLRSLPPGLFDRLVRLERLHLEFNNLLGLGEDHVLFSNLPDTHVLLAGQYSRETLLSLPADNICGRSRAVVRGIVDILDADDCTRVNVTHLVKVTGNMEVHGRLAPGDFDGLIHLKELHLWTWFEDVPPGVLNSLTNLQVLEVGPIFADPDRSGRRGLLPPTSVGWMATMSLPSLVSFTLVGYARGGTKAQFSNINTLAENTFQGMPNLVTLKLAGLGLEALPSDVFAGLSSLTDLDLSMNRIDVLPPGAFRDLASLETLHVSRNELKRLPADALGGLLSLRWLSLNGNQLETLPEGVFEGPRNLEQLYLHSNRLETLPEGVFRGLLGLYHLNLRDNQLEDLPTDAFRGLANLRLLYLDNNRLTTLPKRAFEGAAGLGTVSLGSNSLQSLPSGIFAATGSGSNSVALGLSHNRLRTLAAGSLAGVGSVELAGNPLETLPAGIFTGLKQRGFALVNTRLETLPEGVFDGTSIKRLTIAANHQLEHLPEGVFRGLPQLEYLNLGSNRLEALPEGLFQGLDNLRELSLGGNRLETLPEGLFEGLDRLESLSLRHNFLTAMDEDDPAFAGILRVYLDEQCPEPHPWSKAAEPLVRAIAEELPYHYLTQRCLLIDQDRLKLAVADAQAQAKRRGGLFGVSVNSEIGRSAFAELGLRHFDSLLLGVSGSTVAAGALDGLTVRQLIINGGPALRTLAAGAFEGLSVEELNIGGPNLESLPTGAFRGLSNLKRLSVGGRIKDLPSDIFRPLVNMESLGLNGHGLRALPEGLFEGLVRLSEIHLRDNHLKALPAGVFDGLHLSVLDLDNNDLTSLSAEMFEGLTFGPRPDQVIYSSGTCEIFQTAYYFMRFGLAGNDVSSIEPGIFEGMTVSQLDLSSNKLTKLKPGTFDGLHSRSVPTADKEEAHLLTDRDCGTGVGGLLLGGNRLEAIEDAFDGISMATHQRGFFFFDISDNRLRSLPSGLFRFLRGVNLADYDLYVLNLSNNRLTHWQPGLFDHFSPYVSPGSPDRIGAKILLLNGNQLESLPSDAFDGLVTRAPSDLIGEFTMSLFLQNNRLQNLSDGVFDGLSFDTVNLSGNMLESLSPGTFRGLAVDSLYLDSNRLSALPNVKELRELNFFGSLHLSDNEIESIPSNWFEGLECMGRLDLSNNRLVSIAANSLDARRDVYCLRPYAIDEGLVDWYPVGLRTLALHLVGNRIVSLPARLFRGLYIALNLDKNPLRTLHAGMFEETYCVGFSKSRYDISWPKPCFAYKGRFNVESETFTAPEGYIGVIVDTEPDRAGDQITKIVLDERAEAPGNVRSYAVRLSARPVGGDVTVTVDGALAALTVGTHGVRPYKGFAKFASGASDGDWERSLNLTFTADNWNIAQMIRVRAEEDDNSVSEFFEIRNWANGAQYDRTRLVIPAMVRDDEALDISVARDFREWNESEGLHHPGEVARVERRSELFRELIEVLGRENVDDDSLTRTLAAPLLVSVGYPGQQGFVRVINESEQAGTVRIFAVDDSGYEPDTIELSLEANEVIHFVTSDLEDGNPDKGIDTGIGKPTQGDWRFDVQTGLNLRIQVFVHAADGFLTTMHDVLPRDAAGNLVAWTFNPARNMERESRLRLINTGDNAESVSIEGLDDYGGRAGPVTLTLRPRESKTLSALDLEEGAHGLDGALGEGEGRRRLFITAAESVAAMSLLASLSGHLSNLSSAGQTVDRDMLAVPLLVSAGDRVREGSVRVVNIHPSEFGSSMAIEAFDDSGTQYWPRVRLYLGPNDATNFSAIDLEDRVSRIDPYSTLDRGIGSPSQGDWRLHAGVTGDKGRQFQVQSFVGTPDGYLAAMHDILQTNEGELVAWTFNPASNMEQESRLRLINFADTQSVSIVGLDEEGERGGPVTLTLGPGESRTLSAVDLEEGAHGLTGALGDGAGRWRLSITAEYVQLLVGMNLLVDSAGHMANLSTSVEIRPGFIQTEGRGGEH